MLSLPNLFLLAVPVRSRSPLPKDRNSSPSDLNGLGQCHRENGPGTYACAQGGRSRQSETLARTQGTIVQLVQLSPAQPVPGVLAPQPPAGLKDQP